ncbi:MULTISPECIES: hypothetical protein [Sphingobacterium]|jgi:hypothetical protein|uniref:Uncharacterized protein n=2 Tax=Sphingobacterium multivorum TaxID=28454 RepID=A0A654DKJ2_SPHMU|nr:MULTISPECIES: hypothetical protein [Sphingobacterium]HBI87190.1 hypothetical protein [Sphingobacterium sp.]QQT45576.1 hypothetical protein I6J00_02515 [Sphingobacterium multivorum]QQT61778.1 hypothetical protein I6I97_21775 [Sphingobacterium multivorum]SUJ27119.1 Uncharacterised protein [Sphingobacterium multivorum]VXD04902.1 conserved exported hypothetical protein [Sphingobacterium multivorum]
MNIARLNLCLLFTFSLLSLQVYSQNRKDYFKTQIALGELTDPQLKEVSGITPAYQEGNFWVHNDSGDGATIYLIDRQAKLLKKFSLEGVSVVDCEDIDRVKIGDTYFLVLADIGNNAGKRTWTCLYVFPEPQADDPGLIPKKSIRAIFLKFPGQQRLDAESIMIDPIDNMLYVISKREFRSTVYGAEVFTNVKQQYFTLNRIAELPFTFATASAIDQTGTQLLVKNITHIFYWQRNRSESWKQVLQRKPAILPYQVEPQGEAIAFDSNGTGFYTISERPFGLKSYLYFFERNQYIYDKH